MKYISAKNKVLIVGSSPDALRVKDWSPTDIASFDTIVVINNAWQLCDDWHIHIHPEDFPEARRPPALNTNQRIITYQDYVSAQNQFGGFVYAGGTMALTAAYWSLSALKPSVMAFIGCDMVYDVNNTDKKNRTHFYGKGTADPLRDDITLQNLEAKTTRLNITAAEQKCLCINLTSLNESRLVFPQYSLEQYQQTTASTFNCEIENVIARLNTKALTMAKYKEKALNYFVESGEYWKCLEQFDAQALNELDQHWLSCNTVP